MKTKAFWQKDWLVGLLVAVVLFLVAGTDLMQSLERKAYDLGVRATSRTPSDRIAIIAIDDQSIANLGRWPWPREIHARMIDLLARGQAKVIGHTVFFSEPQVDAGLDYIRKVRSWIEDSGVRKGASPAALDRLEALLDEASRNLDNDRKLADSLAQAHNVLLAMYFEPGEPLGKPDHPPPDYLQRNRLSGVQAGSAGVQPDVSQGVLMPIPALGSQALALGHLNFSRDVDGAVRSEPLAMDYYGEFYPSLTQMQEGSQLIQAIVKIAAAFRLHTVAEGVESAEIADSLATQGVHMLQGYHFGRPMNAESFERYLDEHFRAGATSC